MAKAKPQPVPPLPHEGGSYVLDPGTGRWIDEQQQPAASEPESVTPNEDGPLP
jgi:hypothetical protein